MTEPPQFIDNRDGNTLAAAITRVLTEGLPRPGAGFAEAGDPPARLDIASAFFSPAGFAAISGELDAVERIRLIIGAEPPSEARPPRRRLDETQMRFERRLLTAGLYDLDAGLREERDRFPFTRSGRAALRRLIDTIASGRMETRRYERAFMHAKAYIFAPRLGSYGGGAGVIAGSSNLTRAGVTHNLELNLARYDDPVVEQANAWFERLWEEAVSFDFVDMLEAVFAPWTPFDIFLRTLYQLYGSEIAADEATDQGLPLTNFQKHGAARALRLIEANGGAIVADEVGLGKTFIAGEILKLYVDRRQRCLLICPAQLRDSTWKKFRSNFLLGDVECISYEELAIDQQLAMGDPDLFKEKLQRPLRDYALVVVDEAHNYRNPNAATRAAVLRKLLWGQRRDVLLLTATPVNNSLWDLYHLIRFFMRQDAALADQGILSIDERFKAAAREDPAALSPDLLFPIIDATTVKRTRAFVKKHYSGDTISVDGAPITIVFPEPRAITVRYALPEPMPALFDRLERALDPDLAEAGDPDALVFARYRPSAFPRGRVDAEGVEDDARAAATVGLLRSAMLKRFESSAHAFRRTLDMLIDDHRTFLAALEQGFVVTTSFLKEFSADDENLTDVLAGDQRATPAGGFDVSALRAAVENDLAVLEALCDDVRGVTPAHDPKLAALVEALIAIATQAEGDAVDDADALQKRKVIIFSFFADTVAYLRNALAAEIAGNPALAMFRGRIVAVAGSVDVEPEEVGRQTAVAGFAPISTEATGGEDRFDILITTDVLAEGVNLQQCRNIINYDVPWNPMRLVQRHGRVDRIGSPHARVYLRTIFPAERLDQLLKLEERILKKIALAAASVGVASPVEDGTGGSQVFTETREEIERLLNEDPGLFERGGFGSACQTGEEYRQTLRKALELNSARIKNMPLGAGSAMIKGKVSGVFFCATVGERTYLRFVPTTEAWANDPEQPVVTEVGRCLRLIECDEATPLDMPPALEDAVFDLWEGAKRSIHTAWMIETDPANLQPKVRPLNQRVAAFIRANRPTDDEGRVVDNALDILEAPWPRREELMLRDWFADDTYRGVEKSRTLVAEIRASGLMPFSQPPLLPPIGLDDIELVCWLGIRRIEG